MSSKNSKYDGKWRKVRLKHLATQPACWVCDKKKKKRMSVHHVIGIANDPEHKQLLTLCPSCHDILETVYSRKGNLTWAHLKKIWTLVHLKLQQET